VSITVQKNLETLRAVLPEQSDMPGLPPVVYDAFISDARLRQSHIERLNEFQGLLAGEKKSEYQQLAFTQLRNAMGLREPDAMKQSFSVTKDLLELVAEHPTDEQPDVFKQLLKDIKNKGYYVDKSHVKHHVDLNRGWDVSFMVGGFLAASIALFSAAVTQFWPAWFNSGLSAYAGIGRLGALIDKSKQKPEIMREYPDLFDMAAMESYTEHRLEMAFRPLERFRHDLVENASVCAEMQDNYRLDSDVFATIAAVDMLIRLSHKAPSRAVKLLQLPTSAPASDAEGILSPTQVFTPHSSEEEAESETLRIEEALRERFNYKSTSEAVIDGLKTEFRLMGVDMSKEKHPDYDVTSPTRFREVSPKIKKIADECATAFLTANANRDMPLMMNILLPDADQLPKGKHADVLIERLSETLQRLAIAIQHDRRHEFTGPEKAESTVAMQR